MTRILALSVLLGLICWISAVTERVEASVGSPINVKIEGSGEPKIGAAAAVTITVFSGFDLTDVVIKVVLPEKVTLKSGATEWQGDLARDKIITLTCEFEVQAEGEREIQVTAESLNPPVTYTDGIKTTEKIYVLSSAKNGSFEVSPPEFRQQKVRSRRTTTTIEIN